jgi:F-type H+-transporting ATPase subunit b
MDNFPHLPTILLVAGAVVALVIILNRFLFGPLNKILAARQAEIDDARAEFERARDLQNERMEQIDAQLAAARKEAFSLREQAQQQGRARRDEVLAAARADAMQSIENAKAEIDGQVRGAKKDLESEAESLAKQIAERLLGRPVVADKEQS